MSHTLVLSAPASPWIPGQLGENTFVQKALQWDRKNNLYATNTVLDGIDLGGVRVNFPQSSSPEIWYCDKASLVPRPLPDFILQPWKPNFSPRLRDKIWEWPGDEVMTKLLPAYRDLAPFHPLPE